MGGWMNKDRWETRSGRYRKRVIISSCYGGNRRWRERAEWHCLEVG